MSEPDYDNILLNVRYSYRIAASFQQRMIFILRQIEAAFPELAYASWGPTHTRTPPNSGTNIMAERSVWDFLPLMASDHLFTLAGTTRKDPLKKGDWFMMVRILADDGFDNDVESSASFSGPDPEKMTSPEESESEIYLNAWHMNHAPRKSINALEVWEKDMTEGDEELQWQDVGDTGCQRMFSSGSLADLLAEGEMDEMIRNLRAKLAESGIQLTAGVAD